MTSQKTPFFIQFNPNVLLSNKDTFIELIKKDTLKVFLVIKKGPFKGPFFHQEKLHYFNNSRFNRNAQTM